ncbi:Txe/YoeB family addiction module toxin [Thermophilibacter sp.]
MPYLWDDQAWADYQYWLTQDKKTLRRINALLKDIARTGGAERGIGKGELLRHSSEGLSSVRIDGKNRLTYKVEDDVVRVISCRGHYADK